MNQKNEDGTTPTKRFSTRAEAYARARPGYPQAAMAWICEGMSQTGVAADIGAGTGLSTAALCAALGEGWDVHAVEPNREMRDSGTLQGGARWIDGTAEATSLDSKSVDLVVCAQAFHWFDAPKAVAEFRRVLRHESAYVALVWNTHNTDEPSMGAYRDIMMRHATEPPTSPSCSGWKTADISALEQSEEFGDVCVRSFENDQTLTFDGLIDRAASSSYIPKAGEAFDELRADLVAYFERYSQDRHVMLLYNTTVYRAEVRPR